ncbi:MAG: PAS domain-containing protein [Proteobacteria bacterium]|nr:PAS domain-containing protein [Pseudomonadota bacterium]
MFNRSSITWKDGVAVLPKVSSGGRIALDELENAPLISLTENWNRMRRERPFPARTELTPKSIGRFLRNISIVYALDEGRDYEFRIIGDAHVEAYEASFQGKKMSDLIAASPAFGAALKAAYDNVRIKKRPLAFRGLMGRDFPDVRFVYHESVYLPFGPSDDRVDHIVTASVYVPRDGSWVS